MLPVFLSNPILRHCFSLLEPAMKQRFIERVDPPFARF